MLPLTLVEGMHRRGLDTQASGFTGMHGSLVAKGLVEAIDTEGVLQVLGVDAAEADRQWWRCRGSGHRLWGERSLYGGCKRGIGV
jgi:hypothetical protein